LLCKPLLQICPRQKREFLYDFTCLVVMLDLSLAYTYGDIGVAIGCSYVV